ncbi:MAG: M18 family aminopeptidase [Clostridia bacterium]|nr:M18 family aminopeptidase [Clostridia bacterium]
MQNKNIAKGLIDFIGGAPSAYHAISEVKVRLAENGYRELCEGDEWCLEDGGRYFVVRNSSSLIAFRHRKETKSFVIAASHSDFPTFKLKSLDPTRTAGYSKIAVEKYGGMIPYSWMDRPLSIAGRVYVKCEGGVEEKLVKVERDLLVIPSVAPHLDRSVVTSFAANPAIDMIPLYSASAEPTSLASLVAEAAGTDADAIVSHDLYLYVREDGRLLGDDGGLILSPKLDNLASVYSTLEALLASRDTTATPVLAVFDNEEVGSETKQGAASSFLYDTLLEISGDARTARRALACGFMVSVDNAHAIHPNHPELYDCANAPILGGGIAIKYNASQRYTTDARSAAIFKSVCDTAGVRLQSYHNRADLPGGSTLGSIANTKVAVATVDIGLPQLAMHSSVETAHSSDLADMCAALTALYSAEIDVKSSKIVIK